MIDYLLIGLISGLLVFFSLFFISFLTLSLITGCMRLIVFVFNGFQFGKPSSLPGTNRRPHKDEPATGAVLPTPPCGFTPPIACGGLKPTLVGDIVELI